MKTEGSVPVWENPGAVSYPAAADDVAGIREADLASPQHRRLVGTTDRSIANIERWRANNPNAVRRGTRHTGRLWRSGG